MSATSSDTPPGSMSGAVSTHETRQATEQPQTATSQPGGGLEQALGVRPAADDQLATLRALLQIAQSLSSELDLERLLREVLRTAMEVMQADAGSLLLHDALSNELVFTVVEGGGDGALQGRRMRCAEGLAGWVFSHGRALIVDDAHRDGRFYDAIEKSTGFRTRSLICVPLTRTNKKIGVLEVLNKRTGEPFDEADRDILTAFAAQAAIAIENARLYQNLREERNRILAVEEEVRRELARDVHDGPAQLLSAIVMNVRFVQALLAERSLDMAVQELQSLEELASRTLRQVRQLIFDQRPLILETHGLFQALESYVQRIATSGEMAITLELGCTPSPLPPKTERTIFSIVQEAIGNVKKHAKGAPVHIGVVRREGMLIVSIRDLGPGFDVRNIQTSYAQRGSLGLLNMMERAQQIGGTLEIDSTAGAGTRVTLTVPAKPPKLDAPSAA